MPRRVEFGEGALRDAAAVRARRDDRLRRVVRVLGTLQRRLVRIKLKQDSLSITRQNIETHHNQ